MREILERIVKSNLLFFIVTSITILSLNLTPLIIYIRHSPPGRTFALIHNNTQDFYFYLSLMNQGANGAWLTTDPYTTEPHQSSIIFSYFLWLGKFSKLIGLPYAVTYHLTRIILGVLLLLTSYFLLLTLRIPHPKLTFLFFLFAAPLLHKINDSGKIIDVSYMNWWTGMDPIRRLAYLPHHMFGALFLVVSFSTVIKFIKSGKKSLLVWLSIFSLLLAFVHTPSLLIVLLIIPPSAFIYIILNHFPFPLSRKSNIKNQISNIHIKYQKEYKAKPRVTILETALIAIKSVLPKTGNYEVEKGNLSGLGESEKFVTEDLQSIRFVWLLAYWFIGLFFLMFMVSQTNSGFPWSQYIDWERKLQFPLEKELFGAFGILLPFALMGIIKALLSKRFEYILAACWFVVPILVIPFAPRLSLSNIRLIQGVPYLPLSVLAILGIETVITLLTNLIPIISNIKYQKSKIIGLLGYWVIGLFFLIFTFPTLSWSLKDQIREYWFFWGNVYLDNRLYNSFTFINNNFPKKTATLSTFYTGNYLPAFTNTISFIGHSGYTYNVDQKQKEVSKFFENKMSQNEAKDFLQKNKIDLVFQGPEEKPIYDKHLYPNILKPFYDKEEVTIYTTK